MVQVDLEQRILFEVYVINRIEKCETRAYRHFLHSPPRSYEQFFLDCLRILIVEVRIGDVW